MDGFSGAVHRRVLTEAEGRAFVGDSCTDRGDTPAGAGLMLTVPPSRLPTTTKLTKTPMSTPITCVGAAAAAGAGGGNEERGTDENEGGAQSSEQQTSGKSSAPVSTQGASDWAVYFDGGSRGNPGDSGAGAALFVDGVEVGCAVQWTGRNTNNVAEATGAYMAVLLARSLLLLLDKGGCTALERPRNITILGDSQLIIKFVLGTFTVRSNHLQAPVAYLRDLTEALRTELRANGGGGAVHWEHVRREGNGRADELSNVAMDSRGRYAPQWHLTPFTRGRDTAFGLFTDGLRGGAQWLTEVQGAHEMLVAARHAVCGKTRFFERRPTARKPDRASAPRYAAAMPAPSKEYPLPHTTHWLFSPLSFAESGNPCSGTVCSSLSLPRGPARQHGLASLPHRVAVQLHQGQLFDSGRVRCSLSK